MAATRRRIKNFSEKLRLHRITRGFQSAQGFANECRLDPHTYRHYERGTAHPTLETLLTICDKLNLTPNDLLWDQLDGNPPQKTGVFEGKNT